MVNGFPPIPVYRMWKGEVSLGKISEALRVCKEEGHEY